MDLTLDQALQRGVEAHKAGKAEEADQYYTAILKAQPKHPDANHNMGVLAVGFGKVQEALPFFKTALEANASIAQYWLSYINALTKLDRIDEAKAVFEEAKSKGAKGDGFDQIEKRIDSSQNLNVVDSLNTQEPPQKQLQSLVNLYSQGQYQEASDKGSQLLKQFPKSINLYSIVGAANKGLGQLDEAAKAFKKALSIKPDYAEVHYNIGIILKEHGELDEAIKAYNKALAIKPDYAEAYNNMGNVLTEQGKLEGAIDAYNKALSIKPDYAEAHRNLSFIKEYTLQDKQFLKLQKLYKRDDLSENTRCHLSFTLAKMYEDIGKLDKAYSHLSEGNALRKKVLNYSIEQDKSLFSKLKIAQPELLKNSLKIRESSADLTPIFIIGMPRSGTTLIEQIVSSHSEVVGAGELNYVSQFGLNLSVEPEAINATAISKFRDNYLRSISNRANGQPIVTDKMPQNFRFIPLICAAFPEAKIIHVQRNAAATCWSNYKQYFVSNSLGYCYDLMDVVEYYKLYKDLMEFWQSEYSGRIYNLNYEHLTADQENQTRKLIKQIGLNWEEVCLSPHENKRSVRTASSQQIRQKVYQGSSEAWRKYEPFLNGAFDGLPSL